MPLEIGFRFQERPVPVLDALEAAAWDQLSIEKHQIDSRLLMGWAGYGMFCAMMRRGDFSRCSEVHLLAGPGNNGGDGYVLAWHILSATNLNVFIWQTALPKTADAAYYHDICTRYHESYEGAQLRQIAPLGEFDPGRLAPGAMVIDSIFGTGLNKPPTAEIEEKITGVNARKDIFRVAVDIPSGVYGSGDRFGHGAFLADYTCTFGSYKMGHLLEPGILWCGEVEAVPIGFYPVEHPPRRLMAEPKELSSSRRQSSHKYSSGLLTVLGGSEGFEGAALMSARSFLALGGGLARVVSPSPRAAAHLQSSPELLIDTPANYEEGALSAILSKKRRQVVIIGVGLLTPLSKEFWQRLIQIEELEVIIDGSALAHLAEHAGVIASHRWNSLTLTPHLPEAQALLKGVSHEIRNVRAAALEISQRYNAHVYFKGPGGILICRGENPEEIYLNSHHYELATGGTGDVLCGVLANMIYRFEPQSLAGVEAGLYTYFKAAASQVEKYARNSLAETREDQAVQKTGLHKDFLTPTELIESLRNLTVKS